MTALGHERARVVGWSYGGVIAMIAAREAPERILEGALMLGRAVGAERVVLAFEDPMQAARGALEAAAATTPPPTGSLSLVESLRRLNEKSEAF